MEFIKRILGICKTKPPQDNLAWKYQDNQVELDLRRTPELLDTGGAVRLEGNGLPVKVLVLRADMENFVAFQNRCTHMGRRLDPMPGKDQVQCCSVGKTTYDYSGNVLSGSGTTPIQTYKTETQGEKLFIKLDHDT